MTLRLVLKLLALASVFLWVSSISAQSRVNGRDVGVVVFSDFQGRALGRFEARGRQQWIETNAAGDVTFRFSESGRDDWSVYLEDRGRGVQIQLDLHTRRVMYKDASGPRRELYVITEAQRLGVRPAAVVRVDTRYFHRMTTAFRGPDTCLDVINGGGRNNTTTLAPCAEYSGQYWRLMPSGNGFYRLSTMFRGADMCLDIYNGGDRNNQPHLTNCANYSGQFWRLTPQQEWFRLSTQFRGPNLCLDIHNGGPLNNTPHLTNCANYSGQLWTLRRTDRVVS